MNPLRNDTEHASFPLASLREARSRRLFGTGKLGSNGSERGLNVVLT